MRVSLCVIALFSFVRTRRDRRLRSVFLAQGREEDQRGTYSILHKWHHTARALRHPPELIQQRISRSPIHRTASSSCRSIRSCVNTNKHSSVSEVELQGSFVRLASNAAPPKKHNLQSMS